MDEILILNSNFRNVLRMLQEKYTNIERVSANTR